VGLDNAENYWSCSGRRVRPDDLSRPGPEKNTRRGKES